VRLERCEYASPRTTAEDGAAPELAAGGGMGSGCVLVAGSVSGGVHERHQPGRSRPGLRQRKRPHGSVWRLSKARQG